MCCFNILLTCCTLALGLFFVSWHRRVIDHYELEACEAFNQEMAELEDLEHHEELHLLLQDRINGEACFRSLRARGCMCIWICASFPLLRTRRGKLRPKLIWMRLLCSRNKTAYCLSVALCLDAYVVTNQCRKERNTPRHVVYCPVAVPVPSLPSCGRMPTRVDLHVLSTFRAFPRVSGRAGETRQNPTPDGMFSV